MSEKDEFELHDGNSQMVENWIFSLIPVGVAFVLYVVFILQSEIDNKNEFIAYGAVAGFVGLESYWVVQGFVQKRKRIIILGLAGIALTLAIMSLIY